MNMPIRKNEALRKEVLIGAMLREVRSRRGSMVNSTGSKKRNQQVLSDSSDCDINEKKVCCRRNGHGNEMPATSEAFLNLTPPSFAAEKEDPLRFTFGSRHYTSIKLPNPSSKAKECGCQNASKFDVFASFTCPCRSRSSSSLKNSIGAKARTTKATKVDAL